MNGSIYLVISGDKGAEAVSGMRDNILVLGARVEKERAENPLTFRGSHAEVRLASLNAAKLNTVNIIGCNAYEYDVDGKTQFIPVGNVDGSRLVFDNVTGTFGGEIKHFDGLVVRG
ncbi:MAG: hypothetical protein LUG14_10135 [Synergistaceae bacterium]|nr:hypothetical protein [Synergistaceae bacterium]